MQWDIDEVKGELRGPAALPMTPFNEDFSLNLDALRGNIQFMLDGGLATGQGFIICPCGTGEYVSLSSDESRSMVETALEVCGDRMPVVGGVASLNLDDVISTGRRLVEAGARYLMIPPPCYYPMEADSLFEWYRILAESLDAGIMIYDQSWRAGAGTKLTLPLIERLADLPNIVSLKYGNALILEEMVEALQRFADRFAFVDNSLGYTSALAHMHGATSFISGPATFWPEFELEFFRLLEDGDYAAAERWHARLAPYFDLFQGEGGMGVGGLQHSALIKASLEYVGLYGGAPRPPFRAANAEEKAAVDAALDKIGAKKPVAA